MLNKKFANIFLYALFIIMGVLFLSMFIKNTIIFAIISIGIIYFVSKKFNCKRFAIVLFLFSFIVRLITVLVLKTPIESDFKVLYDASVKLLEGDLSFNQLGYFKLWGYQIGQVVYQAFLLKIWNDVLFIKIVNCFISSGTVVLTYLISKEIFQEKTAKMVSLLYSIFIFPILFNAVLSNQILSTFLMYLAIYVLFAKRFDQWKEWIRFLIVGVLLALSNIIRPEAIVTLTTVIVFCIYYLKRGNIKQTLKKILLIFVSYFAITTIASTILIVTNISPSGLSNKDPLWKFVLGFNYETTGTYSTKDEYASGNKELELELIKERTIGNIEKLPILFVKKIRNFWFTSDIYWSNNYLDATSVSILGQNISGSSINQLLINYNRNIYYFMYICLFLGIYQTRKVQKREIVNFLAILLCVYLGVYLLIEIMPRYAYAPQVALFILSGFGIEYIFNKLEVKRNEKENISSSAMLQ